MLADPSFFPWREQIAKSGYASMVAIPLKVEGEPIGAITIYSRELDAFSKAELDLLTELAEDLAFGIRTLRLRAAHARAEEALHESEARFRSVLDDSRDVIYRFNLQEHRYEYISPSACATLGYPMDEFMAMDFDAVMTIVHPDDQLAIRALSQRLEETGKEEGECRLQLKNGDYSWFSILVSLVKDSFGIPHYQDGILRDITVRKKAEDALLRSEKLASVGRMAATISHEINNPLAAVTNLLFLAQAYEGLPAPVRQLVDMADSEVRRITHITRQSLGFYHESNAPTRVSIGAVLESAVDLMKSKIRSKQALIGKEWDGKVEVIAVAGELRQVFSNLLANSLDAIDQGGAIKMRVSTGREFKDGHRLVRIAIADNGRGIDPRFRERVFEPFFTTKGSVGTGLGLWVTKQIVEKHGGTVMMRSSTDGAHRGTVFQVVLPADPAKPTHSNS
jgi:PAS domain S-box-containing protein